VPVLLDSMTWSQQIYDHRGGNKSEGCSGDRGNTPITPASCSNRPSSSLTTFDPKSLEIRELAEMNEWLIAFGDSLLAAPGRHPCMRAVFTVQ
jgi:hypothetical protein